MTRVMTESYRRRSIFKCLCELNNASFPLRGELALNESLKASST